MSDQLPVEAKQEELNKPVPTIRPDAAEALLHFLNRVTLTTPEMPAMQLCIEQVKQFLPKK